MQFPTALRGESLTRLLQGAALGSIATIAVGFYWGGWVTGGSAGEMARTSASNAVVATLAPVCVERFQQAPNAPATMAELKKVSSWEQGAFIEKGGWATMPGAASPYAGVARACAQLLGGLKS